MQLLSSRDNPRVKHVHALASSARERRKCGETLLDGVHLIEAAMHGGVLPKCVFVSESGLRQAEIEALLSRLAATPVLARLPDALFAHVSPVDSPSGILAVIDLPATAPAIRLDGSVVVLDAVQDPGNLGTILRTAAAAGIREVLLTPGCAQAWSPRVLRAGMGAHFVLAVGEQLDALEALASYPGRVIATGLGPGAISLHATDLSGSIAWLFGAEGQGLSAPLLARADTIVTIPMAAGMESLNVGAAAAICLFEELRQKA